MKKNKVIGIVLIVIGLFSVFGAFSVNAGAPETELLPVKWTVK